MQDQRVELPLEYDSLFCCETHYDSETPDVFYPSVDDIGLFGCNNGSANHSVSDEQSTSGEQPPESDEDIFYSTEEYSDDDISSDETNTDETGQSVHTAINTAF